FAQLSAAYGRALAATLRARVVILALTAILVSTMTFLFMTARSELAPEEDQGFLFTQLTAPQYASYNYLLDYAQEVNDVVGPIPETFTSFLGIGFAGPKVAMAAYSFVPWSERERSTFEITQQIQAGTNKLAGVEAVVFSPKSLPGAFGMPVQYVVRTL